MSSMKYAYSRGNYLNVEKFVRQAKKGIVTRTEIVEFLKEKGLKLAAAMATATVFLSPRKATTRKGCDCRGNFSSQGHKYFMQPLNKVEGQERKFKFSLRATVLDRRVRTVEVKSVKAVTKKAKTKAPAVTPVVEAPATTVTA